MKNVSGKRIFPLLYFEHDYLSNAIWIFEIKSGGGGGSTLMHTNAYKGERGSKHDQKYACCRQVYRKCYKYYALLMGSKFFSHRGDLCVINVHEKVI